MKILSKLLNTCQDTTALISQGQDANISWVRVLQIRMHMSMCTGCRHFFDNSHQLRAMLKSAKLRDGNARDGDK